MANHETNKGGGSALFLIIFAGFIISVLAGVIYGLFMKTFIL